MARSAQKDRSVREVGSTGADRLSVGLIGNGESGDRVGAVLSELGLEFGRVEKAEDLERAAPPGLIVLCIDGRVSGAIGHDVEPLRRQIGRTPVVIVCEEVRPGEVRLALTAGVSAVVLKDQLASTLGPSVEAVRAGQVCVPRRHARQVEPSALSTREKQILGLVVMGYMNSQIAEQLFVAESTVKSHLSSAFGKLEVRSRNEAVELILDAERGMGVGILALGGEPVKTTP